MIKPNFTERSLVGGIIGCLKFDFSDQEDVLINNNKNTGNISGNTVSQIANPQDPVIDKANLLRGNATSI